MKQVISNVKTIEITTQTEHYFVLAQQVGQEIWFHLSGCILVLPTKILSNNSQKTSKHGAIPTGTILSPIPGQIVQILVSMDQKVDKNQALLILSAMKMEYTLKAENAGKVVAIKVKKDDFVTVDQELILIKEDI